MGFNGTRIRVISVPSTQIWLDISSQNEKFYMGKSLYQCLVFRLIHFFDGCNHGAEVLSWLDVHPDIKLSSPIKTPRDRFLLG